MNNSYSATLQYALQLGNMLDAVKFYFTLTMPYFLSHLPGMAPTANLKQPISHVSPFLTSEESKPISYNIVFCILVSSTCKI